MVLHTTPIEGCRERGTLMGKGVRDELTPHVHPVRCSLHIPGVVGGGTASADERLPLERRVDGRPREHALADRPAAVGDEVARLGLSGSQSATVGDHWWRD